MSLMRLNWDIPSRLFTQIKNYLILVMRPWFCQKFFAQVVENYQKVLDVLFADRNWVASFRFIFNQRAVRIDYFRDDKRSFGRDGHALFVCVKLLRENPIIIIFKTSLFYDPVLLKFLKRTQHASPFRFWVF